MEKYIVGKDLNDIADQMLLSYQRGKKNRKPEMVKR